MINRMISRLMKKNQVLVRVFFLYTKLRNGDKGSSFLGSGVLLKAGAYKARSIFLVLSVRMLSLKGCVFQMKLRWMKLSEGTVGSVISCPERFRQEQKVMNSSKMFRMTKID